MAQRVVYALGQSGSYRPWVTDGTAAGTHVLADIEIARSGAPSIFIPLADGRVIFSGSSGTQSGFG